MTTRKRKTRSNNTFGVVLDLVDLVDTTFERLTGKSVAAWLKEFQQRPRELPSGEQTFPQQEAAMPLVDAYAVLGLPKTASLAEVKKNYRNLAVVFHPDRGGYAEAMKLLNNAYERVMEEKKGNAKKETI
ncbi:Chaperone protein DnaJ [subsurface metagenome]